MLISWLIHKLLLCDFLLQNITKGNIQVGGVK